MKILETGRIGGGSAHRSGAIGNNPRGRFFGTGALTESQAVFVEHFVNGSTQTESARRAGYSSPATEGWRLLRLPHVQEAIQAGVKLEIHTEGARAAWRTISALMADEQTPAQVRFQCARWTLEAAGFGLASRAQGCGSLTDSKLLTEMTTIELEEFIRSTRAECGVTP